MLITHRYFLILAAELAKIFKIFLSGRFFVWGGGILAIFWLTKKNLPKQIMVGNGNLQKIRSFEFWRV